MIHCRHAVRRDASAPAEEPMARPIVKKASVRTERLVLEEYRGVMYPCVYCEIRFPA